MRLIDKRTRRSITMFHAMTGNGYTLGPVIGRMLADAIRTGEALPAAFAL